MFVTNYYLQKHIIIIIYNNIVLHIMKKEEL